jgi:hypothetical protein
LTASSPRRRRLAWLALGAVAALPAAWPAPAAAHGDAPGADAAPPGASITAKASPPSGGAGDDAGATPPTRWHGSTLSFDQSMTTQTIGVGGDYQSSDPTYEWWIAFKPRYYLRERPADSLSVNLWMNLYLELTNSDTTTRYHELLLGPTYLWATYARTLRERGEYKTVATIGPRVTIPTDKASRDISEVVGLGVTGGVSQTFRLHGKDARTLRGARLALGVIYNHPFDRTTTATSGELERLRQEVNGLTILDNQTSFEPNVANELTVSTAGDLQILKRLGLSLSFVWLSKWRYAAVKADAIGIADLPNPYPPMTNANPTTYEVHTWLTAAVSYDALDELSLSLGYYNLANQLAPDGTRRSPFWSPSARFFLTATTNLDVLYRRLSPKLRRTVASTSAVVPDVAASSTAPAPSPPPVPPPTTTSAAAPAAAAAPTTPTAAPAATPAPAPAPPQP